MNLQTRDMLLKKLLDTQEAVRDFEVYSKATEDKEVARTFKDFAEECGVQALKLKELMSRINS